MFLLAALLVGAVGFLAYRLGGARTIESDEAHTAKVQHDQLQAATDRPADRAALTRRLLDGEF
jgi:hypothetical protein